MAWKMEFEIVSVDKARIDSADGDAIQLRQMIRPKCDGW